MPHLSIRPIQNADAPAVLEMVQGLAAYHGDQSTLDLDTLLRDALGTAPWASVLVAERDGALVGYATLCRMMRFQYGERGMDIHHLFVADQHRALGVGKALIDACKTYARSQQCSYITVGTQPDNTAAQDVYRRLGFDSLSPHGPRFGMWL